MSIACAIAVLDPPRSRRGISGPFNPNQPSAFSARTSCASPFSEQGNPLFSSTAFAVAGPATAKLNDPQISKAPKFMSMQFIYRMSFFIGDIGRSYRGSPKGRRLTHQGALPHEPTIAQLRAVSVAFCPDLHVTRRGRIVPCRNSLGPIDRRPHFPGPGTFLPRKVLTSSRRAANNRPASRGKGVWLTGKGCGQVSCGSGVDRRHGNDLTVPVEGVSKAEISAALIQ
jgi:hypothetical protein